MSNAPSTFYPKLSAMMICYISLVHIFAMTCAIVIITGGLLYCILFALLLSSVIYICYTAGFFEQQRVFALQFMGNHHWRIHFTDGVIHDAELTGRSILTRLIVILHLKNFESGKKYTICLFSDGLSRDERRVLRRCMRLGCRF